MLINKSFNIFQEFALREENERRNKQVRFSDKFLDSRIHRFLVSKIYLRLH